MKTLVLFVFHQYNDRVSSFFEKALFEDKDVDFVVISNDKENEFEIPHYVKVIKRDNVGYDFGGWSEGLLTEGLYQEYDTFIFVNSSVIGPFLPSYFKGRWTDIFVGGLTEKVKLFGCTINTCGDPLNKSHVQSYLFSMDKSTLDYLIQCEIFSTTHMALTFPEAIWNKEVLMSRKILERGWNIGSLLRYYHGIDFTFLDKSPSDYSIPFLDDVMYPQYEDRLWQREMIVFIKGNRCLM